MFGIKRSMYVKAPVLGEVHVEFKSCVRGRYWLDKSSEAHTLELFIGSTHVIWERSGYARYVAALIVGWLVPSPEYVLGLI